MEDLGKILERFFCYNGYCQERAIPILYVKERKQ